MATRQVCPTDPLDLEGASQDRNLFSDFTIPRLTQPTEDIDMVSPLERTRRGRGREEEDVDVLVQPAHEMSDSEMGGEDVPLGQGYDDVSEASESRSNEDDNTEEWCEEEITGNLTPQHIHTPDPLGLEAAAATQQTHVVGQGEEAQQPEQPAEQPAAKPVSLLAAHILPKNDGWDPKGPEVCETLKDFVEVMWKNPLKRQQTGEPYAKHKRPSNLDVLRKTTMNPEVLRTLPKKAREADGVLAGIQWGVQYAATPLVALLDDLEKGKQLKPADIVAKLVDSLQILGRTAGLVNNHRREQVRPLLMKAYQCLANNDGSQGWELLLGNELAAKFKAVTEAQKMGTQMRPGLKRSNDKGQGAAKGKKRQVSDSNNPGRSQGNYQRPRRGRGRGRGAYHQSHTPYNNKSTKKEDKGQ